MKNEVLFTPGEFKFTGDTGTFEGYASIFGVLDSVRPRRCWSGGHA